MANSPSQKWENGVLVERAIETNRWKVKPDGTPVGDEAEAEAEEAPTRKPSFRNKIETKASPTK